MKFSDHFGIEDPDSYDWFDLVLDTDTRLFVDPFLIFKEVSGQWSDAHDELIGYFDRAFKVLAGSEGNANSLKYQKTIRLMTFKEPVEFCLGYVGKGTGGSGLGRGFARRVARAMQQAITRGLDKGLAHFEELGILTEGINRDRISDVTCCILKRRFISYTQEIADELGIETAEVIVPLSEFDTIRNAWEDKAFALPINPATGRAVILVPKRFLRELPTLNKESWWEFAEDPLRDDLNIHVAENVDKEGIVNLARQRPDLIRQWATAAESQPARPYPVDRDPEGRHNWAKFAMRMVNEYPLTFNQPNSASDVDGVVQAIVEEFKHFVEDEGGWRLLYNDDTNRPKHEDAVQLLFKGIVQYYCRANAIRIDREVYLGKGPVDFAFSGPGYSRILLEIKKMTNSDYWDGLEKQLISYLVSDSCQRGWFLAVRYNDKPASVSRTKDLASRTVAAAEATGFTLWSDWIDARPKASASKI